MLISKSAIYLQANCLQNSDIFIA